MAQAIATFRHSEVATPLEGMSIADLQQEAVLDPTVRPPTNYIEPPAQPDAIFLTGATGFLGAFLLNELLKQTTAKIYCLVRNCKTIAQSKQMPNASCAS